MVCLWGQAHRQLLDHLDLDPWHPYSGRRKLILSSCLPMSTLWYTHTHIREKQRQSYERETEIETEKDRTDMYI